MSRSSATSNCFAREREIRLPPSPLIAITGTNGKSTTTALTAHLLRSAGLDVQMGGNIGTPMLALEPFAPGPRVCHRGSSYQIDLAPTLEADRRRPAERFGGSSRSSRQHGKLRRAQDAGAGAIEPNGTAVIAVDDRYIRAWPPTASPAPEEMWCGFLRPLPLRDGLYADGTPHHGGHERQGVFRSRSLRASARCAASTMRKMRRRRLPRRGRSGSIRSKSRRR